MKNYILLLLIATAAPAIASNSFSAMLQRSLYPDRFNESQKKEARKWAIGLGLASISIASGAAASYWFLFRYLNIFGAERAEKKALNDFDKAADQLAQARDEINELDEDIIREEQQIAHELPEKIDEIQSEIVALEDTK